MTKLGTVPYPYCFLLVTLLCAFLTPVFGSAADDHFRSGNQAYEAQSYEQAIAHYDSAVALRPTAAVYYNRGNAYFKTGALGRAIADYNRAFILRPTDPDIRHNLEFLRAYRPDKTTAIPNPIILFITGLIRLLDLATARALAAVLFFLAAAALALGFVIRRRFAYWVALALTALWLYTLAAWLSWQAEIGQDRAVVIVPELLLRSGPGEEYKDLLIVHDGLEVIVRNRRGRYVLVQAPGGEGGWADASGFEQIFR